MIAKDIRKGMILMIEGELYQVLDAQHITPGNWRGYSQIKARNLKKGNLFQNRFRSTEDVEQAFLDMREMEYLYQDGEGFVFMDVENYEQITLGKEMVGEQMLYVTLNSRVKVALHDGTPITVELPSAVTLRVTETEPGFRGNTATNVTKPAKLETGLEVKVPPFIEIGQKVKVDTRTGEFLERVSE
ncbi:MAG: elongation factor P [Planctomycetales bacterium]|nr:elongation factor P [Planctomycetales bacterium]